MKLLLDTHALVWSLTRSDRLPARVQDLLSDRSNRVLASALNAYEIEFKRQRSEALAGLPAEIQAGAIAMGFEWLPVLAEHAVAAGRLPRLHGDPFDRLLVGQALVEQATIVTRDAWIAPYGAPVAW